MTRESEQAVEPAAPFEVRIWGARGTLPCGGPSTLKYGGDTSCVELRCGERRMIFDFGSGIRALGVAMLAEGGPIRADLFITHTHHDHVIGLPHFKPAYVPNNRFDIWSGHLASPIKIKAVLAEMMDPVFFPVPLDIMRACVGFNDFGAGDLLGDFGGAKVTTVPLRHPGGSTGYRVDFEGRAFCYVTDHEHLIGQHDDHVLRFVDGADLVLYDSTYDDDTLPNHIGWGHSTWQEGCRLAKLANVKRWLAFHHDPMKDDAAMDVIDAAMGAMQPGAGVARQGLTYRL